MSTSSGRGTAVPAVVEVRDRNDLPVSGASVVFLLGEGGAATLNAGLSQVAVTTNALGQAAVTVNPIASGAVQLQVSAAFQGQTAAAAIAQTNFATAQAAAAGAGTTGSAGGSAATGAGGGGGAGTGTATGAVAGGGTGGGLGTGGIVGAVAGGVGAAAAGVALTRDAAPAPPVAALGVTPNGVGMAGLTEYRFDASGSSDPNQDALTYSWDFGDGRQGTGTAVTHIYAAAGTYEITLTVSDGGFEATTRGSVEVSQDLNGRFVGVHTFLDDRYDCGLWHITQTLELRQEGRSIRGTLDHFGDQSTTCASHHFYFSVSGNIASDNFVCPCDINIRLQFTSGTFGPPDDRWDWENEVWGGVVEASADAINFGNVFRRQ